MVIFCGFAAQEMEILWLLTESLLGSSVCQGDYTKNHWGSFHKSSGDLEQSNKTWTTFFKTAKRSPSFGRRCTFTFTMCFVWMDYPTSLQGCQTDKMTITSRPKHIWINSFTCHTQQKSDQTVNRKSALPVKPLHSWPAGLTFALNQGCQTSCPLWP